MREEWPLRELRIRSARPEDSSTVLQLWDGLVSYHKTIERVRPQRWAGPSDRRPRMLENGWREPDRNVVLLAELDGDPVGFLRVSLTDEGPCPGRIETLFVSEAARGHGVGASLLERACAWCREHGAGEVTVEFIEPNELARGFYEHAGFQPLLVTHIRRL